MLSGGRFIYSRPYLAAEVEAAVAVCSGTCGGWSSSGAAFLPPPLLTLQHDLAGAGGDDGFEDAPENGLGEEEEVPDVPRSWDSRRGSQCFPRT